MPSSTEPPSPRKALVLLGAAILATQVVLRGATHMIGVDQRLADWAVLLVIVVFAWIIGRGFQRSAFLLAGIVGAAAGWLIWKGDWIFFVFLNEHVVERIDNTGILQTASFMVVFGWVIGAVAGIVAAGAAWISAGTRKTTV